MGDQSLASIGHHGFWGLSSSFDWLDLHSDDSRAEEPLSVLLIAPGDIRHILTTVSRRARHGSRRPIHFYLLEPTVEVLCREILLLEISLDIKVPIRQRANIFLEVFGNLKIQERTSRYIELLGNGLRDLVVHQRGRLEKLIDFSSLKYREKDLVEESFKYYSRSFPFDIDSLFDHRVRGHLAERYDSRIALFDWDWHYSFQKTASIIHIKMYKDWREKGIAFEFGDQSYTDPNRSLVSYTEGVMKAGKDKGMKKEVKGYWGDIICSPYFSFGIDCDTPNEFAQGLFEIVNKVNRPSIYALPLYALIITLEYGCGAAPT